MKAVHVDACAAAVSHPTIKALCALLDQVLAPDRAVCDDDGGIRVLSDDGEAVARISSRIAAVLYELPESDRNELLTALVNAPQAARSDGYYLGRVAGRREIIRTVHDLLGIDRLIDALDRAETGR